MSEQGLAEVLAGAGLFLRPEQLRQLETYRVLLQEAGKRFNLTAVLDKQEIWRKHFLDSLLVGRVLPGEAGLAVIDVGSGAGFPGLPLKVWRPDLRLTLLEANGKKAGFLRRILEELQLEEAEVLVARAEEAGRQAGRRESYDAAVARAVAPLNVLAEYCLPLVRPGGLMVAAKGPRVEEELAAGERAARLLGGGQTRVERLALPGTGEERRLVVVEKVAVTPLRFPRRPGKPAQKPLGSD